MSGITRAGISANPSPNSRRVGTVLNEKYETEQYAIWALDTARGELTDSEGELLTDRVIIRYALEALGDKLERGGYKPPAPQQLTDSLPPNVIKRIVDHISGRLTRHIDSQLEPLLSGNFAPAPRFQFQGGKKSQTEIAEWDLPDAVNLSNMFESSGVIPDGDYTDEDE